MGLFFLLILGMGWHVSSDYGVAWDEPTQRDYGRMVWEYSTGQNRELVGHRDQYHGPLLEWIYYGLEKWAGPDVSDVYQSRHLWGFFVYFLGVLGIYFLAAALFGHWVWGLLAAVLLVLSPRQFAHGFFNSKDIPFMVASIWCLYAGRNLIRRFSFSSAILAGLCSAILISIRVLGVLMPALIFCFWVFDRLLDPENRLDWRLNTRVWLLYFMTVFGATVLFWPILWEGPVTRFWAALVEMSHYPWSGYVLYLGRYVRADQLPWHYSLVWMGITIPLAYLGLGLVSGGILVWRLIWQSRLSFQNHKWFYFCSAWLVMPIALIIGIDANLYDGWRHLFFVYPVIILLAVFGAKLGWSKLSSSSKGRSVALGVGVIYLLSLGFTMGRLHPYEHVFFNALAGNKASLRQWFEGDYWGVSYKEGLEAILAADERQQVTVLAANFPGQGNALILPESQRKRLHFVTTEEEADYFISNFRWHPNSYPLPEVYAVYAGKQKLLGVYRLSN